MADTTYKVRDPSGAIREISGPEGASDEEIISQAKKLFSSVPSSSQRDVRLSEKEAAPDPLKKLAPFYLGPLGGARAMQDAGHALDRFAYGAGDKASELATKVGASPEVAGGVGLAANVATQAIPTFGGGALIKAAVPVMTKMAQGTMQSALKPDVENILNGNAARAINLMLDKGFNATAGGVNAMRTQIYKLNDQIKNMIANSTAMVDKSAVANRLQDSLKDVLKQVNPQSDIKAIEKAWTDFLQHPDLVGRTNMTVQEAQAMKQGTYKQLGEKAYNKELTSADTAAQKKLAFGLKEEVAAAVPGVDKLNKSESELINALHISERRAALDGNKNFGGLAWLSHNPATWAAFMADKSPLFKSILARMMNSGNVERAIGGTVGAASGQPPKQQ